MKVNRPKPNIMVLSTINHETKKVESVELAHQAITVDRVPDMGVL
jgi:hypothetical protein